MPDHPKAPAAGSTPDEPLHGIVRRFLAALVVSALTAVIAFAALTVLHDAMLQAALAALASAAAGGVTLHSAVVGPLVRSHGELTDRYQAALAEALSDPLTGLGNHRAFQEELDRQVDAAQRYGTPLSLVLLDIDEFKLINDRSGHARGDRALADFGRLATAVLRRVDRSYRVGGDEFAVLLPHTDAEEARAVARRLLAAALQPPLHQDNQQPISFSAGVSAMPALAVTRDQLYSQADAALYAAKRAGRTEVVLFDAQQPWAEPGRSGEEAIVEVIARGQLRPVYQPIVAFEGSAVLGYEGLIRPVEPAPFADPAALFAAAAATGHLVALDLGCIDIIVRGASRALPHDAFLSVNVTPRTVESPEFSTPNILSILARHEFAPSRLVLELTEREPMTDIERVRNKFELLRAAGVRLAADDLGAGNSGLRLLADLRFEIIKVDLSLVQRSSPGAPSSAVISSVVAFAARAGALVVGEGVETAEQVAQLKALGVTAGQGYLFGRPAPLPADLGPLGPASQLRGDAELAAPMAAWRRSIGLPTPVSTGS